ncbi:MAG TPA: beta-propeller fold lactonase family protein, partial [Terrimicrobiaceae bacterium]
MIVTFKMIVPEDGWSAIERFLESFLLSDSRSPFEQEVRLKCMRGRRSILSPLAAALILLAKSSLAQFAYVTNGGGSNNVSAYRIGENGNLTSVAGSPFAAGNLPSGVTVEASGRFLYVVNEGGNNVSAYSIDKSGGL